MSAPFCGSLLKVVLSTMIRINKPNHVRCLVYESLLEYGLLWVVPLWFWLYLGRLMNMGYKKEYKIWESEFQAKALLQSLRILFSPLACKTQPTRCFSYRCWNVRQQSGMCCLNDKFPFAIISRWCNVEKLLPKVLPKNALHRHCFVCNNL